VPGSPSDRKSGPVDYDRRIVTECAAVFVLDRWRHLVPAPQTIACSELELMSGDWEPPIVKGTGEIRFTSLNDFAYALIGTPDDPAYCRAQLQRQRDQPYDGLKRFRLTAVAADGTSYTKTL